MSERVSGAIRAGSRSREIGRAEPLAHATTADEGSSLVSPSYEAVSSLDLERLFQSPVTHEVVEHPISKQDD